MGIILGRVVNLSKLSDQIHAGQIDPVQAGQIVLQADAAGTANQEFGAAMTKQWLDRGWHLYGTMGVGMVTGFTGMLGMAGVQAAGIVAGPALLISQAVIVTGLAVAAVGAIGSGVAIAAMVIGGVVAARGKKQDDQFREQSLKHSSPISMVKEIAEVVQRWNCSAEEKTRHIDLIKSNFKHYIRNDHDLKSVLK